MQKQAKECVGRFEEVCLSHGAVWFQSLAMLELQKRWRNSRVHSLSSLLPPHPLHKRLFQGRLTFKRNCCHQLAPTLEFFFSLQSVKKTLVSVTQQTASIPFPFCFREHLRPIKRCLKHMFPLSCKGFFY